MGDDPVHNHRADLEANGVRHQLLRGQSLLTMRVISTPRPRSNHDSQRRAYGYWSLGSGRRFRLTVVGIGTVKPELFVCDVDRSEADPLELLRQVRFVLSVSLILVYTACANGSWKVDYHAAGANGLLSKQSNITELAVGIRSAMRIGSFTDPRCVA